MARIIHENYEKGGALRNENGEPHLRLIQVSQQNAYQSQHCRFRSLVKKRLGISSQVQSLNITLN